MKIEKTFIKKMISGILRQRKQSFFDRQIMHARREWFIGVLIGLGIVGFFGYSSYTTYTNQRHVDDSQVTNLPTDNLFRAPMMKAVLEDFTLRKDQYEDLKSKLIDSRSSQLESEVLEVDKEDEKLEEVKVEDSNVQASVTPTVGD
jgi:hypothetical protein